MCNPAVSHHHQHLNQGRIQELRKEGPDGERRARAYNGGLGAEVTCEVQGQSPWSRGQDGEASLKLKAFLALQHPKECENVALSNDFAAVFKVSNTVRTAKCF